MTHRLRARLSFNDLTSLRRSRPRARLYRGAMDAKSLTAEQRGAVRRQALRYRDYLGKLVARMEALSWRADDPMRVAAVQSRDAVQAMLKALEESEPPAPFLRHYGPSAPVEQKPE